ncbi:MAG TPA: helix-turn-helix transcriptional regulator [Chthoniobacteraceae bacterium]|nr:helix-turn-helix transcriptional regulator [Chthoniobacteraceae bacterium]
MPLRWNLPKLLDAKGITPYRLAKLTGLSVPSAYTLAKPAVPATLKTSTLVAICKALDCTPGDLLDYRKR